ncbi:hypothetical protein F6R97_28855 [Pseudomonas sp. JV414]|nr:hypothetical protein [Pseudomonas sp. JV414]
MRVYARLAKQLNEHNRHGSAESVGAGLLAKAVCQTTSMLDVQPPSRASPLPQDCGQLMPLTRHSQ